MSSLIFRVMTVICLFFCTFFFLVFLSGFEPVYHNWVYDFTEIAIALNIRNLVTSVYLGPRIFDTFLEVMVVVLTVYGIKFVRSKDL